MKGVEIGNEPALTVSAQKVHSAPDRRMLNVRWLACTVLTGMAGAALMAGALFIAVDWESEFADLPQRASAQPSMNDIVSPGRTDRLPTRQENISSRQIIQESTVRKVGGKEFVEVVPYVRVTASLAMTRGSHASETPAFDPIKIFADVGAMDSEQPVVEAPQDDRTLQVSHSSLSPNTEEYAGTDGLDISEIEASLRELVSFSRHDLAYAPPVIMPIEMPGADGLDGMGGTGPHLSTHFARSAGHGTNTTAIAKRTPGNDRTRNVRVAIDAGDTLEAVLVKHGATPSEAADLIATLDEPDGVSALRPGDEIGLKLASAPNDPGRLRPIEIELPDETDGSAGDVAANDSASFMNRLSALGGLHLRRTSTVSQPQLNDVEPKRANVFESIYETGLGHELPRELVEDLVRIFSFDVDFQRNVSLGDSLDVFYAETGEDGNVDEPQILHAAIDVRGETHRFYRFRSPDDGVVDYYDEDGKSAKKFLIRKPIKDGTFRSGFGKRRHPILGYQRMHYGVDWAAPTGTPIMAAGSGTVIVAEWKSTYGRHVRIRHANGYETSYSHMSGFGENIQPGAKVHQGQVIGYVGSTGMSTGPHLHYEVTVNDNHVDPMRIRLPRGRTLEGPVLEAFEREKRRIQALMERAPTSSRLAAR